MSQKKNEGILFSAEIRVVGSYTDRLLRLLYEYISNLGVNWLRTGLIQKCSSNCEFTRPVFIRFHTPP